MDISFHPKNPLNACAYFAVFSYPEMEVLLLTQYHNF